MLMKWRRNLNKLLDKVPLVRNVTQETVIDIDKVFFLKYLKKNMITIHSICNPTTLEGLLTPSFHSLWWHQCLKSHQRIVPQHISS